LERPKPIQQKHERRASARLAPSLRRREGLRGAQLAKKKKKKKAL
jgi:hypothetical protein